MLEIPESVLLVILLFYYNSIESSILTDNECDKLLSLFEEQNKFEDLGQYSYKLIYNSHKDGKTMKEFVERCHGKPNLLCIVYTTKNNVFGGYTSKGWTTDSFTIQDDDAFIFSIRSSKNYPPKIFNAIKGTKTLQNSSHFYCIFGSGYAIWIGYDGTYGGCYKPSTFETPEHRNYFTGNEIVDNGKSNYNDYTMSEFTTNEVEVFQLVLQS